MFAERQEALWWF